MQGLNKEAISEMNRLGKERRPFAFLIDFKGKGFRIFETSKTESNDILWRTPKHSNFNSETMQKPFSWNIKPLSKESYSQAFDVVHKHIVSGNSYLVNLTMPTQVQSSLSLKDVAQCSKSPYLVYLKNEFVSFSPEIFVRINQNKIKSFPMKGTIDAKIPNAKQLLLTNKKEMAEHHTIVDLIRNDLSKVAQQVEVTRFGYIDKIKTHRGSLLQMSSEISGQLNTNWNEHLGDIFAELLPAGSITGAPKAKTVEIIKQAEPYQRGWYTGVFGYFDGISVDSCVLIRYLEQHNKELLFKSGGGITHLSNCAEEYQELKDKVYVPII